MHKGLKITLWIITAWLTIIGAMFLFFPNVARMIMASDLPDTGLNMLYGQVALTFAYLAFIAARGGDGLKVLTRLLLTLVVGHVLVFGYQLIAGLATFAQVGVALVVNAIFTILLIIFRRDLK